MLLRIADLLARRGRYIIIALACMMGVSAALSDWAVPLENGLGEIRNAAFRQPASGKTIIVEIDSKSLAELGAWPWPRSTHGNLTDRLREAGAELIAFDITFTSPAANPEQDRAFAEALERAKGRVILPAVLENVDGELGERHELLPIAPLRAHADVSTIWIRLDDDLYARRLPHSVEIAGAPRLSLATYLAGRPVQEPREIHLDWSIDPTTFPKISYADVLAGRFDADFFKGKNVLIGATSVTLGDRFLVPNYGRIPGVYVQATGSETLRHNSPAPVGDWPALLAACVLIAISMAFRSRTLQFAALTGTFALILVLPHLIREYGPFIIGSAPALVAGGAALLLSLVTGIANAMVARVTRAPASQLPNLTAMSLLKAGAMTTVAVRLRNHAETTAHLGPEAQGELLRAVSARLTLAASNSPIFQVDDHSFAWRTSRSTDEIQEAVEGLHGLLASGIPVRERTVDVTINVGICDDRDLDPEAAVAAALVAANQSELRGVSWSYYESGQDAEWRLSLLGELDRGIDEGHVWVAYQPQFDLTQGRITGAEALVRWSHPGRGNIPPDDFIPVLEESDRIEKLTLHVLQTALKDFAGSGNRLTVAINISMRMIGKGRLYTPIRSMLAKYGMDPSRLILEITESAAMIGDAGIKELNRLRALGVNISIDDYGTGQSTLSYLKKLPATELKIDQSFVRLIAASRSDATMVNSTIKLAHALGLTVVAEGVETPEVLAILKDMRCDTIQGNLVGKPAPFRKFAKQVNLELAA